jgi:hypothetical protein
MGWKAGGSNAGRVKQREQTSRPAGGTILPPILWVPGVKGPGCDTDHSPPSSAEVENEWSYTCTPPTCLCSVDRWNFTFTNTTKCQRCMFTIRTLLLVHNILVSVGMKWASVTKSRFQLAIGSKLKSPAPLCTRKCSGHDETCVKLRHPFSTYDACYLNTLFPTKLFPF